MNSNSKCNEVAIYTENHKDNITLFPYEKEFRCLADKLKLKVTTIQSKEKIQRLFEYAESTQESIQRRRVLNSYNALSDFSMYLRIICEDPKKLLMNYLGE